MKNKSQFSLDKRLDGVYNIVEINDRGAADMISARRDIGVRGKGEAAERANDIPRFALGRNDNIGATVTDVSVLRYWIFGLWSRYLIVP